MQSFCDLTASNEQAVIQTASTTPERRLDSTSRTSLSSEASGDLELKQSRTSPTHSKRSSSAGKRVLSGNSLSRLSETNRVSSAGDVRLSPSRIDSSERHERTSSGKKRRVSQTSTTSQLSTTSLTVGEGGTTESKLRQGDGRKSRKSSTVEIPFWDNEIVPLLTSLENTPYSETARLCEVCGFLWSRLEQHDLLGRTGGVGGTKKRATVLRTVFKLLDHKDPRLLLKVAKIITAVSVLKVMAYYA